MTSVSPPSKKAPRKQGPVTTHPGKKMADYLPGPEWMPKWMRKLYGKVIASNEGVLTGGGGGGGSGPGKSTPPPKKDRFVPLGAGGKSPARTGTVTPTPPGSGITYQGQRRPAMAGSARPHGSTGAPVSSLFGESIPGHLRAGSVLTDRTRGVGDSLGSLAHAFSAHAEAGESLGLKGAALGGWQDAADRLRAVAAQLTDIGDSAGDASLAEQRELAPAIEALKDAPLTSQPAVGTVRGADGGTTPSTQPGTASPTVDTAGPEPEAAPADAASEPVAVGGE